MRKMNEKQFDAMLKELQEDDMVNEFEAVQEMSKKIPNIIGEIEKLSKEYETGTFVTGMPFLHMLFDAFVDSQNLDREEVYMWFACSGIKHARKLKENSIF